MLEDDDTSRAEPMEQQLFPGARKDQGQADFDVESPDASDSAGWGDAELAERGQGGLRRECRICKLGEDECQSLGSLISPCSCSGSMRYIHTKCLQRWLELKRNTAGVGAWRVFCEYVIVTRRPRADM